MLATIQTVDLVETPTSAEAGDLRHQGLGYVPALDGLRGAAVAGVVAHHLGYLEGGFLGVDLFFVLSGFLITSLVLTEWVATDGIDLGHFWLRRGRRLLPALFVVLVAVAFYAAFTATGIELPRIREDGLATLLYVQNWHEIAAGTNYWDQFAAPSPLRHMWSLAIEEQFYLVWPLVLVVMLTKGRQTDRRRRVARLFALCVGLGVASAVAMVVQHHPGEDVNRVYYGTDTRAAAILIGAALAAAVTLWGHPRGRQVQRLVQAAGIVAALGLTVVWFKISGSNPRLYEGGFLFFGLAVGALILAVTSDRDGLLSRVFSIAPLRWLGLISYGLYLWHWPVIVFLTAERAHLEGLPLAAARVALSLVLTVASYHLVEQPIRRGRVPTRPLLIGAPVAFAACALLLLASTYWIGERADELAAGSLTGNVKQVNEKVTPKVAGKKRILLVGDSGAASIGPGLKKIAAEYDAEVINKGTIGCVVGDGLRRQRMLDGSIRDEATTCGPVLERWRGFVAEAQPDVVLLHEVNPGGLQAEIDGQWVGNCEAPFREWYLDVYGKALDILTSTGVEVVVTSAPYSNNPFQQNSDGNTDCRNAIIKEAVEREPNARLVDLAKWMCRDNGDCDLQDQEFKLREDGLHFKDEGAEFTSRWLVPQILDVPPK
jgi:peptidoglycan/LPS O-acetylase OafA/YrhL